MLVSNQNEMTRLRRSLTSTKKAIVIDTETNKDWVLPEDRYCMGISFCIDDESSYVPVAHNEWGREWLRTDVTGLLDDMADVPIVFHNAKFDISVLEKLKLNVPTGKMYDTMIMAHLIDENEFSYELDDLVRIHLGIRKDVALAKAMDQYKWEHVPAYVMAKYAEQDAKATWHLYYYLSARFEPYENLWSATDRDFLLLLREMENAGIRLDRSKVKTSLEQTEQWCANYVKELGFDPGKRKLLQEYVFGTLGLTPRSFTKKTGQPQIDTKFLERSDHPWCKGFREYKVQTKRLQSYYRPYLKLAPTGRIHPSFKQHGTVTGRLSCFDPNMQQIPRESDIKGFFLPEDGCELWELDYKTLEFRLAAVYAKQENALEIFRNEGDIHQLTADLLGVSRFKGKTYNFAMAYGAGPQTLSETMGISLAEAKGVHSDFHKAYSAIRRKSLEAGDVCRVNNGRVKMWHGRYRHFKFSSEYHIAWSACIQGGAFQIVKVGMLNLRNANFDMRNQVHDAVWLNIDPSKRSVESQIEEASSLMSDWTTDLFGLRFSVDAKRLA